MSLAPEIRNQFEGKHIFVEFCADGTVCPVHPPGEDDGGTWIDLNDDGATRQSLRRKGIGRELWNAASQEDRALARAVCQAQEDEDHALRALFGVAPPGDTGLAPKARNFLRETVEASERLGRQIAGFGRGLERDLIHPLARSAVRPLTILLRTSKREATSGRVRPRFTDSDWQQATAAEVNDLLASHGLAQICRPAVLARLKTEAPPRMALELLSSATGLSEDDLRRDTVRQNRGQRPPP